VHRRIADLSALDGRRMTRSDPTSDLVVDLTGG
jgi:hypothetical protein